MCAFSEPQGNIRIEAADLNKRLFEACPVGMHPRYLMFVLHDPSVNQWLKAVEK